VTQHPLNSQKLPGRFSYGLGTRLHLSLMSLPDYQHPVGLGGGEISSYRDISRSWVHMSSCHHQWTRITSMGFGHLEEIWPYVS